MSILSKPKDFLEKEKQIWIDNKSEIEKINKRMILILTSILFVVSFTFSIVSTFVESFFPLRTPYYILFIVAIFLLLVTLIKRIKIPTLILTYVTYTSFFIFSIYASCAVGSFSESTLVLGFLFIFCITLFDKMARIITITIAYIIMYIIFVTPSKDPSIVTLDFANVIGFGLVASIIGGYLRQLQLDNIDLRRQASIRESTDSLTGLFNKRKLYDSSSNKIYASNISAMVMIDIDHFKLYNDNYGHQQGDLCLKSVSSVLLETTKQNKVSFYRYGGEEFLGIVWKEEEKDVKNICEEIVTKISNLKIEHNKSKYNFVTVSIGYSKANTQSFNQIINEADKAMYASKNNGRNKITEYSE